MNIELEPQKVIDRFDGTEYRFLSNFWVGPVIEYMDMKANTVEHLFQAYKTNVPEERKAILEATSPGKAKRLGGSCTLRKDWEEIKYMTMLVCVSLKFKDPELRKRLVETGDAVLIEGNTWHDNTWGDCHCDKCKNIEGKNWLGKILMTVREENRKG